MSKKLQEIGNKSLMASEFKFLFPCSRQFQAVDEPFVYGDSTMAQNAIVNLLEDYEENVNG